MKNIRLIIIFIVMYFIGMTVIGFVAANYSFNSDGYTYKYTKPKNLFDLYDVSQKNVKDTVIIQQIKKANDQFKKNRYINISIWERQTTTNHYIYESAQQILNKVFAKYDVTVFFQSKNRVLLSQNKSLTGTVDNVMFYIVSQHEKATGIKLTIYSCSNNKIIWITPDNKNNIAGCESLYV